MPEAFFLLCFLNLFLMLLLCQHIEEKVWKRQCMALWDPRGQAQLPACYSLLGVWTEGGEQWGLERSLYLGRRTTFSV